MSAGALSQKLLDCKNPLFIIASGVLLGATFCLQNINTVYLYLLCLLLLVSFFFYKNLKILILSIAILFGGFYTNFYLSKLIPNLGSCFKQKNIFIGQILSSADDSGGFYKKYKFQINKIVSDNGDVKLINSKVQVYGSSYEEYSPGDIVQITGVLDKPKSALLPGLFDERKYLLVNNIYYVLKADAGSLVFLDTHINGIGFINDIRDKLVLINTKFLKSDNLAIVNGIVFGSKACKINDELNSKIRNLGLSHIVSASGFNVAILSGAIFTLLKFLAIKNQFIASLVSICAILFYCVLADSSASIVRASIFLILVLIGNLFDKKLKILPGISVIILAFFLVNPLSMLDIGLQLSIFAFLGLALFSQDIEEKLLPHVAKYFHGVVNLLIQSVTAQILVAPLLVFYFHNLQVLGLISNLLAVPLASVILITGLLGFVFVWNPYIEWLLNIVLKISSDLFLVWVTWLSKFSFQLIHLPPISFYVLLLIYSLLMFYLCLLFLGVRRKRFKLLLFILVIVTVGVYYLTDTSNYLKIFFLPKYNNYAFLIVPPKQKPMYFALRVNEHDNRAIRKYLELNNIGPDFESYNLMKLPKVINSDNLISNETNKLAIRYKNFKIDILKNHLLPITDKANYVFLPMLKKNDPAFNKIFSSYPKYLIVNDYKKLSKKSIKDIFYLKSLPLKTLFLSECATVTIVTDGVKEKIDF